MYFYDLVSQLISTSWLAKILALLLSIFTLGGCHAGELDVKLIEARGSLRDAIHNKGKLDKAFADKYRSVEKSRLILDNAHADSKITAALKAYTDQDGNVKMTPEQFAEFLSARDKRLAENAEISGKNMAFADAFLSDVELFDRSADQWYADEVAIDEKKRSAAALANRALDTAIGVAAGIGIGAAVAP